jgi:hypothetical protein
VADHQPERQQKLDEVRDVIKNELIATEGAKLAEKQGQALLAQLKSGKGADSQKWGELQTVSRRNPGAMIPAMCVQSLRLRPVRFLLLRAASMIMATMPFTRLPMLLLVLRSRRRAYAIGWCDGADGSAQSVG